MKKCVQFFIFNSVVFLCACKPLQQAPLVYSSKLIVGMDLSGGTAEGSTFAMNVGVKSLDAAYVPVAVSKDGKIRCQSPTSLPGKTAIENCEYNPQTIQLIRADHGIDSSDLNQEKPNQDTIVAKQQNVLQSIATQDVATTIPVEQLAQLPVETQAKVIDAASLDQSRLKENIKNLSENEKEELSQITEQLKVGINENALKDEVKNISPEVKEKALQGVINSTVESKAIGKHELGSINSDKKVDALSVFGKFTTTTKGNAGEAGLTAGKIFSTGIAAQNLTKSVELSTVGACLAGLNTIASKIKDDPQRASFLVDAVKICDKAEN